MCSVEDITLGGNTEVATKSLSVIPTEKKTMLEHISCLVLCPTQIGLQKFIPLMVAEDCILVYHITMHRVSPTT